MGRTKRHARDGHRADAGEAGQGPPVRRQSMAVCRRRVGWRSARRDAESIPSAVEPCSGAQGPPKATDPLPKREFVRRTTLVNTKLTRRESSLSCNTSIVCERAWHGTFDAHATAVAGFASPDISCARPLRPFLYFSKDSWVVARWRAPGCRKRPRRRTALLW